MLRLCRLTQKWCKITSQNSKNQLLVPTCSQKESQAVVSLDMGNAVNNKNSKWTTYSLETLIGKLKMLQGDPHFIAMGMGIGAFVGMTPTIPFHTVFALLLAWLCRGSKTAAVIGIWVNNPLTIIFLYLASYKVGILFIGNLPDDADTIKTLVYHLDENIPLLDKLPLFTDFIRTKFRIFIAMNVGGLIIGTPVGILTYFLTKRFMVNLRFQKIKNSDINVHDTTICHNKE